MSAADEAATLVAYWAEQVRTARGCRDSAIRAMRHEGASLSQIADAAGLSKAAVAKILRRPV